MLLNYLPVLIFIIIGILIGILPLVLGWLVSPKKPDPAKLSPYECGFAAFEDTRIPFDVRYYLVAILFIIFDLETAFLFPWGVILHRVGWPAFWTMAIFIGLLLVGFIYEWKKGALEWE